MSSDSTERTRQIGADFAARLEPGSVVALQGDLGAGKTEFVRGMVSALGGDAASVSSPTFTIAQEYLVDDGVVIHVDAYRVEDPREFVEMGMEEYLDTAHLVAVEWPDRMAGMLPPDAVAVHIEHQGGGKRSITLP
ncbi:MAG: tRNA (adenosine(37)-N6)-threonylcarbamoyltransferase complex ATPase subunit type 1 TsaE [Rhodothermales bacterium]|nr:tRNA (adenosine(37)-N6)-threonylcarbamoyltransferase complex ATPase subunit type 1 TsaE [Rhodothermales bacterium]